MASSIFSSNTSEGRWVDQLSEHFIIYVDNPPSIFQVPKNVSDTKPEAYAPRQIGIGAYHHLRPDLDERESQKLEAVKKFLKPEQREDFKSLIVDKVKALEPFIRSCYNKYLDLDGDTLAWIMAIDGVYLLHLLKTYSGKKPICFDDRNVAQDIMMMENQLPCFVLKEIRKALQPPDEDKMDENDDELEDEEDEIVDELKKVEDIEFVKEELFSEMLSFCKSHTPLALKEHRPGLVCSTNSPHLLHIMYTLIRNELYQEEKEETIDGPVAFSGKGHGIVSQLKKVGEVAADLTGLNLLMLLANLPWEEFVDLFKKDNQTTESSLEEIKIPSASQLHQLSKIEFEVWEITGHPFFSGVKYYEHNRTLCLPKITLNTDSEVILRNLVAYEVASGSNNVVSGYVDFMCGIIDTAKDVDLLKGKNIIKSDLPSEEIAKMFNGISKSGRMKPDLEETTQKLNVIYDRTFRVKAWRFIKDHLVPAEATVKLILGILLVFLLTLQAFCQVYGCSARWFGKNQIRSI